LIQDLKQRTGLDIKQVEVLSIDFLRDCARLKVHFYPTIQPQKNSIKPDNQALSAHVKT